MEQATLEIFSRLAALEAVVMHLQMLAFRNAKLTSQETEAIIAAALDAAKETAFPGFSDPVESDQFAAAFENRLSTLLRGAKSMLELQESQRP